MDGGGCGARRQGGARRMWDAAGRVERPTRLVWRREADVPKRGMGVADGVNAAIRKRAADAGRDREGRTANEIGVAGEISASNATKGDLLQFSHVSKVAKNGRPCDLGKWRRKIRAISRDAKKLQQTALRCRRTLKRWAKAPWLSLAALFVAGGGHVESGKGVPPAPVTPCRQRFSLGALSCGAFKCPPCLRIR